MLMRQSPPPSCPLSQKHSTWPHQEFFALYKYVIQSIAVTIERLDDGTLLTISQAQMTRRNYASYQFVGITVLHPVSSYL